MDATKDSCHQESSTHNTQPEVYVIYRDAAIKCWNSVLINCETVQPAYELHELSKDWPFTPF